MQRSSLNIRICRRKTSASACGSQRPRPWKGSFHSRNQLEVFDRQCATPSIGGPFTRERARRSACPKLQNAGGQGRRDSGTGSRRKPCRSFGRLGLWHATRTARSGAPSFILFREANLLQGTDYLSLLLPALTALEPELLSGCVAVFRNGRLRVRRLPFSA